MGRMSVNAGGGGADLDAITAGAEDIVSPKVGLDNEGEPLAGTLKDNSGVTKSAAASLDATNSRVQLTVPETGKYSLTSKLYATYATIRSLIGLTAAKIVSGNTILGLAGTATSDATISKSAQLLKDVIAYGKNGVKYVGTIASLAAKTYTPGTSNQTIAAGQYLSGAQTIKGDSNLKAANIKKGVNIFGVTGTWEGYVAAATDLYKQGANAAGFTCIDAGYEQSGGFCTFETTYIHMNTGTDAANEVTLKSGKSYNFAGYKNMKLQVKVSKFDSVNNDHREIRLEKPDGTKVGEADCGAWDTEGSVYTASISLADFQTTFIPVIHFVTRDDNWQVQRIWIE